jgi:putative transposase
MILTYKYRLKGGNAKPILRRMAWATNTVWNFAVETQRKVQTIYKQGLPKKWPSHFDLQKLTAGTSKELGAHAQSVQSICEQFAKSRDQHKKCSKFRSSSGPKRSLGWVPFQNQSRQVEDNSITYLGHRFRFFGAKRRPLPSNAKGGCFAEDSRGRWYVCFQVEVGNLPTGTGQVGIREWSCSVCGASHDRDRNAALNILNLGLSAQPRVDESRRAA